MANQSQPRENEEEAEIIKVRLTITGERGVSRLKVSGNTTLCELAEYAGQHTGLAVDAETPRASGWKPDALTRRPPNTQIGALVDRVRGRRSKSGRPVVHVAFGRLA